MKNGKFKNIIKVLLFMLGVFVMITALSRVMERKDSYNKYAQFFDEKNEFDVIFLGTSHVVDAIYPLELWKDYGIVSYNFGGHGNKMATNYWVLMNLLDYTTPKLVVLDCSTLGSDLKLSQVSRGQSHIALDVFPLTLNKIYAAEDLFDGKKEKYNFIWKFLVYHNRWSDLNAGDFSPNINVLKGAEYYINVAIPDEPEKIPKSQKCRTDVSGNEYIGKIIEECQNRGIEILLTYIPSPALENRQEEANLAYDIADNYGINYINFLDMDVVNYMTDCLDANSHLNPSGGRKVTDYLGKYIKDNYNIEDRRNDVMYASWNEDYVVGTNYKFELLKEQETIYGYLCMLADNKVNSCIYIKADSPILKDDRMHMLLNNISAFDDLKKIDEAESNEEGYLIVFDNSASKIYEVLDKKNHNIDTSFGNIIYKFDEFGNRAIFINEDNYNYLENDQDSISLDVQIIVIDGNDGNIKDVAKFYVDSSSGYISATIQR